MELSRPINTSHEGEGASVIGSSNLEATNDEEDILGDETLLKGQSKRQTNEMGNNVASSQTNRTPQKEFPFRRCGCKAHLRLKMVEGGKWMVMSFNKEHNHDLIVKELHEEKKL
uniref:FAR1 domain-containing protein n=1 Tax=Ananas comosus var. bracteatus TaxID=296719 RepID=A0A6V7Q8C0_ANACO|nr:unnamed protein product [Ananas comosus var. bracteatus]